MNGDHVLLIETTGADPALIIFDYAVYTTDVPVQPSHLVSSFRSSESPSPPPSVLTDTEPTKFSFPSSNTDSQPVDTFSQQPSQSLSSGDPSPSTEGSITPFIPAFSLSTYSTESTVSPSMVASDTQRADRHPTSVVAIVGAIAGTAVLIILVFISLLLDRRRRVSHRGEGTISVFNLLDDNPPLPPPRNGRFVFPSKEQPAVNSPIRPETHSIQSSISSYSETSPDVRIHIPMTSFRFNGAHSPITRNGVPIPPEQAEIVREILLGSLAVDSVSLRRGSESSVEYTPTTETGSHEDDLWPPVVHVDSGLRISREMMELPPVYAAS
ncbi:hypothetical protein B0H10DRAFT_2219276 [Mycena sp. CBHHK59/15]|nr:hypothetical protein B0H10DRAFT_2219276 [Mycena sp. CBHHK59/15]